MRHLAILTLALSIQSLFSEEMETRQLRVLTIGNRAPFQQVVRDGIRYEVDPPEGSLPPRRVEIGVAAEDQESEEENNSITLRLGEISAHVAIPVPGEPADSQPTVTLRDQDTGTHWLKAPLTRDPRILLVVWRVGEDWSQVRFLALDDSENAVPRDVTRVINVTPGDVGVTWGGEKILLKPGGHGRLEFPSGAKSGRLLVQYAVAGKPVNAIDTIVENQRTTRRQWVVFKADRADARQPVQVLSLAEPR